MRTSFFIVALLGLSTLFIQCKKDNLRSCKGDIVFAGTVDGDDVCYFLDLTNGTGGSGGYGHNELIDLNNNICGTDYTSHAGANDEGIWVTFQSYYLFPCDTGGDEYNSMTNSFSTGSHTYVDADAPEKGIEVAYFDATGTNWSTRNGSQVGSTFVIDDVEKVESELFGTVVKVGFYMSGSLNCTVYDDNGNSKVIDIPVLKLYVESQY